MKLYCIEACTNINTPSAQIWLSKISDWGGETLELRFAQDKETITFYNTNCICRWTLIQPITSKSFLTRYRLQLSRLRAPKPLAKPLLVSVGVQYSRSPGSPPQKRTHAAASHLTPRRPAIKAGSPPSAPLFSPSSFFSSHGFCILAP